MGGRGSKYSTVSAQQNQQPATATQAAQQMAGGSGAGIGNPQPLIQNQTPNANNTPAVPDVTGALSNMTDDQLANLMNQSKTVDMPNHLNDVVDATQKFVYASGANGMPTVLPDAQFDQYLKDNGISRSQILSRSTGGADYTVNRVHVRLSADQVTQMMKYSQLNYIGGKYGGHLYGSGAYFDMNGGSNTGYAQGASSATAIAVLNPKTAHVISKNTLQAKIPAFATSHPKFARAVGRVTNENLSIYALAMGYNVIRSDHNNYHNVIDRSALVYRQSNV